ncbi:hypothetical protein B0F90DRAFT_1820973 [Multifurca ochricompacta]|uniref:DNA2/NAM7 helicase-like C-terminal domain-containing protein n=1 Tax=Multifurca ochricompacta TaxID=376703 RepID=A0AAD4LY09_9AGAM|nr:hypothetical protein B0F90DRAFT_1820973 [Multifurca ochricompacta]
MRAHAKEEIVRVLLDSSILPKKGFPLIFHGVKGEERRTKRSPSYFNIVEASIVRDYCQKLLRILSENLLKLGRSDNYEDGKVVEYFGGLSRAIPGTGTKSDHFGHTRSNKEVDKRRAMGFLQNRQRLNVAITRAQALLITIGDPDVLGKDPLWKHS